MATYIDQYKSSPATQVQKGQLEQSIATTDADGLHSLPAGGQLCMVLIGKTGQGKSETANMLCGKKQFFEATDSTSSVTVKNKSINVEVGGRQLKIVDTPGCMDTKKGKAVLKDIADAITTNPEGYDAFLIVVKYPARMTAEETSAIKQLEKLFGKEMYEYSVVIFTHGDCFKLKQESKENPMTFTEYVQQDMNTNSEDSLGPLLNKVGGRAVMFSNMEKDLVEKRKMIIQLVEKIDEIRVKKGKRYDNNLFKKARELEKLYDDEGQRSYWLYKFMLGMWNWCSVM